MHDFQPDYYLDTIIRRIQIRHIPYVVDWELTYKCNLKCTHCYVVPDCAGRELSLEECKRILDQLAAEGCLFLLFTGGEILLRSDFFDIALYARKKGFALTLFTNGTLITPNVADRIKDLCPLSVGISIYGSTTVTHEAITQVPGSFDKSIGAIKLLRKRGIRTRFKSPLMRNTISEYDQMRTLAKELDAEFKCDTIIIPKQDGSKTPLAHQLTDDEVRDIFMKGPLEVPHKKRRDDVPLCGAGVTALSINPYGEVSGCIRLNNFNIVAGDLRCETLSDIWRGSRVFSKLRSATFLNLDKCADCDIAFYCTYCPALALMDGVDFPGPSTVLCRQARIMKEVVEKKGIIGEQSVMTPHCEEIW